MTEDEWRGLHEAHNGSLTKHALHVTWDWAKDKDDKVLRKVYEIIGREGKHKRLGGIIAIYDVEFQRQYPRDIKAEECDHCFTSGLVYVILGGTCPGDAKMLARNDDLQKYAYLARSTIPCICATGRAVQRSDAVSGTHRSIFRNCAYKMHYEIDRRIAIAQGRNPDEISQEGYTEWGMIIKRIANSDPRLLAQLNTMKRKSKWSKESE